MFIQSRGTLPGLGAALILAPAAAVHAADPVPPATVNQAQPAAAPAPRTRPGSPPGEPAAASGKGQPVKEYKPRRWSLSPGGSQRKDWLQDKERFDWPAPLNARNTLGLPEWLSATLEYRVRYETLDVPFVKGQAGSQYQVPMQTVLWLEAHHESLRAGVEFWDARQFREKPGGSLNNTMVDAASFTQMYAAWSTPNLLDSGLGFEAKGGIQTLEQGSRRLVARNAFRNTTNAFTGLLLRLRDSQGDWEAQAFATRPLQRLPTEKSALLNNDYAWDTNQEAIFTGVFGTAKLPWNIVGEWYVYYLGEDSDSLVYRRLVTPGFRFNRAPARGELDFEIESIGQAGERYDTFYGASGSAKKKNAEVGAWYEHVQAGYTFDAPWDPRLMAQWDYASGGTSGDGTSHSFDTLYGARRWEYGPTGIFGPFARNNINSPGARLFVVPHRDLASFVAYRAWWMADRKALWQPANLVDPGGKSGDFMGHTVEFSTRWDAHENLALEAGWACLIKGGFARNAPGAPANHENSNYFYVQTQLRF